MSKENKNYSSAFINSLVKYTSDAKTLDALAELHPIPDAIAINDKKSLSEHSKALRDMKKEYDLVKRTFKANVDTIKSTGNNFISELEIEFREITFKLKDRINKYKEIIDDYKKQQSNILGTISSVQTLANNQTILGGDQMLDESDMMITVDRIKSDKEIIDFFAEIIQKTNMKLVAKANDFKGIQIYHSNEPGSSMDPRIALSIMIENYYKQ